MNGLHCAAYNGDIEQVAELLRLEKEPDARDERGFTPLMWAAFRAAVVDQVPVIELLIASGADPNAVSSDNKSNALILAVQSGEVNAVRTLVRGGAHVDQIVDGVTALMIAARSGDMGMTSVLIDLGADPAKPCGSFTAADYADYGGHDELAMMLSAMRKE